MVKGWWLLCAVVLCIVPAWGDCEKTKSDYDVVYCLSKIYLQADKELNASYQKLVGKLKAADDKRSLKTAQLAWIEARNKRCTEARADTTLVDLDCATRTTVERTQFLNDRYRECVSAGCMSNKLR
jgi:uncharacterized protein YecT (DUF1311 family)